MQCPIQCTEDTDILLDYCAHKLTPEATADLERHMNTCEPCSRFTSEQKFVWATLDEWEALKPSRDFDRRLYARIEEYRRSNWWQRFRTGSVMRFGWNPAVPLAAACVTVIAAVFISVPGKAPVTPVQQSPRLETIELEQVERNLEDLEMLKQLSLTSGR